MPVVEEGDQYLFKQLMCYYILEELLMCGKNPKTPRVKIWKLVLDLDTFESVDWAGAVHKHLMDAFFVLKNDLDENEQKDEQFNFMGCTPFLQAILFKRMPSLYSGSKHSSSLPVQNYNAQRKTVEGWRSSLLGCEVFLLYIRLQRPRRLEERTARERRPPFIWALSLRKGMMP